MKNLLSTLLLLVATIVFAQQQTPGTPPFNPNSQPNPNSAPPNQQSPAEQMPPDTRAPAHNQTASPDIEKELQAAFDHEPVLKGTDLKATADDDSVVVSGTVENEQQHKIALQLVQGKAGDRKIVDKIVVRKKT
ncbi:MAG: hypothetical protein DMG65_25760 [Candidatus Angelobacter sp. Gp1-AA117]|nr:MAG: hypothetical protein DMG65_25760 [Candidatus Angelobacter sp. Gp1-AA117]